MTTSSLFMDDYSSEDYSSDDYEDRDGFYCILPKATRPHIHINTQGLIDDETLESNESSETQTVSRLEVAAPDSLSSLSDHERLPDMNSCVELADAALEKNVVVEADAMTQESSEAVEADAALETTVVEHGDVMIEESYDTNAVEANDGREAGLAVEEEVYAMIEQSSEAARDAVEESGSKAVEANSLVEPEEDAVEGLPETVEEDVAVEPESAVDAMTQEFSQAVEADDAALETSVAVEDGDAIIEEFLEAVEADAAIETSAIKEAPVIDKQEYSSEVDDSEEDYCAQGDASEDYSSDLDASEDYSSEADAISMFSEDSVEFKDYCVKVEIDTEDYNSSELDVNKDYSSEGDVISTSSEDSVVFEDYCIGVGIDIEDFNFLEVDTIEDYFADVDAGKEYSSELDANKDYSSKGDAISISSEDSEDSMGFKDYCVEVGIDIEDHDSSEVDTIDNYSSGGDVIDEFSSQGDAREDYSSEGDAISMSSEDSMGFKDYCLGVGIDMEDYNSSEVDTIEDHSAKGDVIDEFSSQEHASKDYSSEDSVEFEDYYFRGEIDHLIEGYDSSELDWIENYSSEDAIDESSSERDATSREEWFLEDFDEETTILVQAILDFSTIPPLFYLPACPLFMLKSSMNSFFGFGYRLCSFISAMFCKEPIANKYA